MRFKAVLADPPWSYRVWSEKGKSRSAETFYKTQDAAWIASLPVQKVAAPDCALFLWATYPNLIEAIEVIKSWGFTYKTAAFTWVKLTKSDTPRMGLGYWTRSNAEVCLLATRGNPKRLDKGVEQIIECPIGRHSAKPQEAYVRIERLVDGPYLEMFARPAGGLFPLKEGWTQAGNEIDGLDMKDALCRLAAKEEAT